GLTDRSRRPTGMPIDCRSRSRCLIVRCKLRAEDARAAGTALSGCPHPGEPDAGLPQRPRSAPDALASLLKLAPPQNYFLCRDPGAGFSPSCLVDAPWRRVTNRSTEPCGIGRTLAGGNARPG